MKITYLFKVIFLGLILSLVLPSGLIAQVTIGSEVEPNEGELLGLKENDNQSDNSSKGLMLPRVKLEVKDQLYPMFESSDLTYTDREKQIHTGLMVYNLTDDLTVGLCPGPYIWNGSSWDRLWDPCLFLDLLCATMGTPTYSIYEGGTLNSSNSIHYNSGVEIDIATAQSHSFGNGLSLRTTPQKIEKKVAGVFNFEVHCDGTTPVGTYELSLLDLGETLGINFTDCKINVEIKSNPLSLICSDDIYVTGYKGVDMNTVPVVRIPYTLPNGTSLSLPAGVIGTLGNIEASVDAQELTDPSGFINVRFSGVSENIIDEELFTINIMGEECSLRLSVIGAPADCADGTSARAFVFQQNSKWYVITTGATYSYQGNTVAVAQTIECNTEEEALRHPKALQYCGTQTDTRCIRLFDRSGTHVANVFMTTRSAGWLGGIAEANMGCWASIIAYGGSRIESKNYAEGYLGAINMSGGFGYLGITQEQAVLTDKPLR